MKEATYRRGLLTGKRDSLKNPDVYDSTSACQPIANNGTPAQIYACLQGYSDGVLQISRYHAGYLQGVQGAELNRTHAHEQEFFKGYFKGFQGLVEGYNGLPSSVLLPLRPIPM